MEERISLDYLTRQGVSVCRQKVLVENGEEYVVGLPHRRAYINSEQGREEIEAALSEPYRSAVLAVWGDAPSVTTE